MAAKINETHQVGAQAAFFIPLVMQMGMGFISFPQIITQSPEQDGWISVLINGLATIVVMWFILRLLENEQKYGQADFFSLHRRLFGKWAGNFMNFIVLFYVLFFSVMRLRSFIEVLQVEIFPQLSIFYFSFFFCLIVWYIVGGGIRNILGVSLLSFIYLMPVFLSVLYVVSQTHFSNLLPILNHTPKAILSSSFMVSHEFLGFEFIMFIYPFIKQPKQARKWAYFALLTDLYTYLFIIIIAITYFSQKELQNTIWPIMTMWKSIQFPFFEHVDIIFCIILLWNLIPSISLCSWSIARGIKFTFKIIKMKYSIIGILILTVGLTSMIKTGEQIKEMNRLFPRIGFFLVYLYIPLLLFFQWLKKIKTGKTS